jgi:hypothetical protein
MEKNIGEMEMAQKRVAVGGWQWKRSRVWAPLERADQGGSNGGKFIENRWILI